MMSKRKSVDGLFDGRHFDRELIILRVRWYLRYKLSLRDLVEMMSERGIVSLLRTTPFFQKPEQSLPVGCFLSVTLIFNATFFESAANPVR